MLFDWSEIEIEVETAGKYLWKKGLKVDTSWPGYVTNNHLWLIYKGQGEVVTHKGKFPLKKGELFWFKPGFRYKATQNPARPVGMYGIHFNLYNENGNILDQKIATPPDHIKLYDYKYIETLFNKLVSVCTKLPHSTGGAIISANSYKHLKANAILRIALMEILESIAGGDYNDEKEDFYDTNKDILAAIADEMHNNPAIQPSVQQMADRAFMTPSNFCQAFKRRFNKTPLDYALRYKMQHATRLLSETAITIKEISVLLGYDHPKLFTRQFKRIVHMTPTDFRKKLNE